MSTFTTQTHNHTDEYAVLLLDTDFPEHTASPDEIRRRRKMQQNQDTAAAAQRQDTPNDCNQTHSKRKKKRRRLPPQNNHHNATASCNSPAVMFEMVITPPSPFLFF